MAVTVHGDALTLVALIYAPEPFEGHEEAIAQAVDTCIFTDEAKADLYATLAERLTAGTPYTHAVAIVTDALTINTRRFPHG
jgi:hypothetical protein